jgi:hypothetical protein
VRDDDETEQVLLARMDERLKSVQSEVHALRQSLIEYITKHEFFPVKMISLGLAGLILAAVVAAIVAQVMR